MKRLQITVAIVCVCSLFTTRADARTGYDGSWSLAFITKFGPCDPTYGFSVDISNGVITQPNLVKFRGHVTRSGLVHASVAVHEKYAAGSGRLAGTSGHGTWIGHSGNTRCTGYWTAQRN